MIPLGVSTDIDNSEDLMRLVKGNGEFPLCWHFVFNLLNELLDKLNVERG